ncbi:MAG: M67 family metallopeptidase [Ilumatobacter sp.]|uniref:Mov34/MPN/PAD-1 family protein n=1 Tax=Ilumatobacter sp. TaxID=1967498 RepID=UPI00374E506C|nr:M67 family metallopeptidase [Ilumatobacter sp.]
MIEISRDAYNQIIGEALDEYPLEMCGLLVGPSPDQAPEFHATHNDDASARVYTVNPRDFMRVEVAADNRGWEINGVVHSHTHSEPYPSPTDVAAAVDPRWHYVIVSLKRQAPEMRSYRIADGEITEEQITVL